MSLPFQVSAFLELAQPQEYFEDHVGSGGALGQVAHEGVFLRQWDGLSMDQMFVPAQIQQELEFSKIATVPLLGMPLSPGDGMILMADAIFWG